MGNHDKTKREPPEMNSLDKMEDCDRLAAKNAELKQKLRELQFADADAMALVIAHEGRIEAINLQLAELKEERTRLRAVYWASRAVLRYNGIDKDKTIAAVGELRNAIDSVMSLDSGREDN